MPIRLFAPRYWLTWLALGFMRLCAMLPYSWLVKLGSFIGVVLLRVPVPFIRTARRNIELCLPQMSPPERSKLLRRHLESLGIGLFETAFSWWASPARAHR